MYALYFDDRNSLIKWERLTEGGSNESAVSPRALAQRAVRLGATQVVLAHNHPGGLALPSQADLDFTASVGRVLYPLGIRLLDHIIVDSEGTTSRWNKQGGCRNWALGAERLVL